MIDRIKKIIEVVGLVPAIVGFFKITPQWFRPSPSVEPEIEYAAAFVAFVTFVGTLVYLQRSGGPARWTPEVTKRHMKEACVGVIASLLIAGIYMWFVRTYPHAGVGLDLLQMGLWASFFALASFFLTAFACIFKAP
jgi:hypothetical protein